MARAWEADPSASFERRLGKSPVELGNSDGNDERLVIIPGSTLSAAKADISDA